MPGDKVFDFSHNLCIADGMPFYMKYLYEAPGKQEMLDTWAGDYNYCWQLDPSCTVKFCDDYHTEKYTYTAVPDSVFLSPERDFHSRFFTGPLPDAEELRAKGVPENLCALYRKYLEFRKDRSA